MKPEVYISEVVKHMKLMGATRSDIIRITGWSISTCQRRFAHPETITLGEQYTINSYLGIK